MQRIAKYILKTHTASLGISAMVWLKLLGAATVAACAFLDSFVQAGPMLLVLGMVLFWRTVADSPQPFKAGWLWGSIVSFAGIFWISKFIEFAWWALPVTLVWSMLMGAQWGLVTLLARTINASWLAAPTVGLTWAIMEWSREYWPIGGFTFGSFSMCAYDYPNLCALAGIVGHWGIGAWLVTLAVLLAQPKRKALLGLWLLLLPAYGLLLDRWSKEGSDNKHKSLKVAMFQTGVYPILNENPTHRHSSALAAVEQLMTVVKGSKVNSRTKLDAIIMPESTSVIPLDNTIVDANGDTKSVRQVWHNWAKAINTPVILGARWQQQAHNFTGAVCIKPDGTEQRTPKNKVLPNVTCASDLIKIVTEWYTNPFKAGNSASLWELGDQITVSPGACYDETFPTFARDRRRAGAQMLLFCDNDGYFPDNTLYRQHYMHGMLRAIECACPVAQCGSTGRTGAWSPRGVEIIPAPLSDSINLVTGIIPVTLHWTPFLEWGLGGLWGAWLLCSLACMLQLLLLQSHRQGRRATSTH